MDEEILCPTCGGTFPEGIFTDFLNFQKGGRLPECFGCHIAAHYLVYLDRLRRGTPGDFELGSLGAIARVRAWHAVRDEALLSGEVPEAEVRALFKKLPVLTIQ